MRDHELELIAALVEGRLEDESEARALIESAPEFRAEYEAQKIVFEALRGAGSASLADIERAALHRDVWTSLREGADISSGRGSWYHRWVAVAAGLFVVIGLLAVLSQGGGEDSGETFAEIAADLDESATTTAAASDDAGGAVITEQSGDDGADTRTDSTTSTVADSSAPTTVVDEAGFYSAEAEKVRSGEFDARLQSYEEAGADPEVDVCIEQAGLEAHRAVATLIPAPGIADENGEIRLVAAAPEGSELTQATIVFVDLSTCQVVHIDD
jgi:hypothetical protein